MLWFASDNGPEGMTGDEGTNRGVTGGMRGRKRSLFSGGVNVPGLLEWPGHAQAGPRGGCLVQHARLFAHHQRSHGRDAARQTAADRRHQPAPAAARRRHASRPVPLCFRYIDPKKAMHDSPMVAMLEGRYKLLTNFSADGKEDCCTT